MRRKPTMAILILVSIILQSTVCQMISIASIKPNLLIILTVSFGLMRGKKCVPGDQVTVDGVSGGVTVAGG